MQKLSSHLDVLVFSIALGEIGVTAALLEEIGGDVYSYESFD